MKYYQLDKKALEKELNTDFDNGLTKEQVFKRYSECSNFCNSNVFSIAPVNHDFTKPIIFLVLSLAVYVISAIFIKSITPIINSVCLCILFLLFFAFLYFVVKYINNKIKNSRKNTFVKIKVIRDGVKTSVSASALVYGDVIFLEKGDYIPCDARVISSEALLVDESYVNSKKTVKKESGVITDDNVSSSEMYNTVFCGSFVLNGTAAAVVTDVGERVYVLKTHKSLKRNKTKSNSLDYIKFIHLVSIVAFSVLYFVSFIIDGNNTDAYAFILFAVSMFTLDIPSLIYKLSFTNSALKLLENGVYLNNIHSIESINQSDICLLEQEMLFDKNEALLKVATKNSVNSLDSLTDLDLKTLLYYNLASPVTSEQSILHNHGIDIDDFASLCPILSSYTKPNISLEMCGRVHNSENLLFARANFTKILEMCSLTKSDISENVLNSLFSDCNEIIGVAVKKLSVIPNDLSEEMSGFILIGFVGFNKTISNDTYSKLKTIKQNGIVPSILYTGDNKSVSLLSINADATIFDYNQVDEINKESLLKSDLFYNYNENPESVISACNTNNLRVIHGYDKESALKEITFSSITDKPSRQIISDVVCDFDFDKIFNLLIISKETVSCYKNFLLNLLFLLLPITICSYYLSFIASFEQIFVLTVTIGAVFSHFCSLLISTIFSDWINASPKLLILKYVCISAIMLLCLIFAPSYFGFGIVLIMLFATMNFGLKLKNFLVIIPALVLTIVFYLFGNFINVLGLITSVLVGLAFSILFRYIKYKN